MTQLLSVYKLYTSSLVMFLYVTYHELEKIVALYTMHESLVDYVYRDLPIP